MSYTYILTENILTNLTGKNYISPLAKFNLPMKVLLLTFEILSPISLFLNLFVFFSCVAILFKKTCDRPALVFIAYNSLLDVFTTIADAIVITGAVNPSLANADDLPDEQELEHRCSVEKAMVAFTIFSSFCSVLLLTFDRFIFITKPLNYNTIMNVQRAYILTIIATILSIMASIGYSMSVSLPWDKVCTFTHVLPLGLVIFWNALFFFTWFTMHIMYAVILVIALRHKKMIQKTKISASVRTIDQTNNNSSSSGTIVTSSSSIPSDVQNLGRLNFIKRGRSKVGTISNPSSSVSFKSGLTDHKQIATTIKTVRYIVILLFVYSLVELPCVTVAMDDLFTHAFYKKKFDAQQSQLPSDDVTAISLLHCSEKLILYPHSSCEFQTDSPDLYSLPWEAMMAQMSHSLYLTRIFTISLLGWIINTLADPLVYAFWYPVFRKHLNKLCCKLKPIAKLKKKTGSSSFSPVSPGHISILAKDNNNISKNCSNNCDLSSINDKAGSDFVCTVNIFVIGEETHM